VVIGDQSSGKSSVLESISRIKLPRGSAALLGLILQLPYGDKAYAKLRFEETPESDAKVIYDLDKID